jgi:hypothetical protein
MKKLMLAISFVCFTGFLMAATTGGLVGKITAADGQGLPGVTITATSPSLMGQKTAITDVDGHYRLLLLPPGTYELKIFMSGFQTITRKDIVVRLGQNFTINQVLKPDSLEETIVVVAEQQLIDSTSTTTGENWTTDYIQNIPVERSVGSILSVTPGVTRSEGPSGGMVIAGASGTESSYIIDGMNTTNIESGVQGKQMNFDFIEEIQIKTGGYEAEYGRATGGVVNMLTKSGGNELSGSVFYYMKNKSMASDGKEPWQGTSYLGRDEYDYGVTVGGPIIKDKLWFFVAFNPTNTKDYTMNNESVTEMRGESERYTESDRNYWSAKLTYNINENNTLIFSAFADPQDRDQQRGGETTVDRHIEFGGTDWILKYDSIINESFVLSAQIGTHEESAKYRSMDGNDLNQVYWYRHSDIGTRGGIGWGENTDRSRDIIKISGEWFLGDHAIKFGYDHETNTFNSKTRYAGGATFRYYGNNGDGTVSIRRRMYAKEDPNGNLNELAFGTGRYQQQMDWLQRDTETVNDSFFIQDKWDVTDNLMISAGVRFESQEINGNHPLNGGKFTALDITDMTAPRIGVTWDMFGDGKSKLYSHWGKFYSSIPLDINNRAFAEEVLYFDWWTVPIAAGETDYYDFDPAHYADVLTYADENLQYLDFTYPSGVGGAAPVADDLKAMSQNEFILGYDYLLTDLYSVGIKYTKRTLNEILEDISFDKGNSYIIANPGEDLTFTSSTALEFVDATGVQRSYAAGDLVELTAEQVGFAKPERDYTAYELTFKRKFANHWSANLSIIESELVGNFIGGELPFYGQTDPGITAAYDLPSTLVNTAGAPLPFDRPLQIKTDGMYVFDFGMTVGWQYSYMDGTPIGVYGEPDDGSTGYYGEFRLIKNGKAGRTDNISTLDLNLSYTYDLKSRGSLTGYFYIFNVFDAQKALEVNQRYTYDTPSQEYLDAHNGGSYDNYIDWIDGAFNSMEELDAHMAEAGMEKYSHWGEAEVYQAPQYFRFGIKWAF